jgi:hypothetical protein
VGQFAGQGKKRLQKSRKRKGKRKRLYVLRERKVEDKRQKKF